MSISNFLSNPTVQTIIDSTLNSLPFPMKLLYEEAAFFKQQIYAPRHDLSEKRGYRLYSSTQTPGKPDTEIADLFFKRRVQEGTTPSTRDGTPQKYKIGVARRLEERHQAIQSVAKELGLKISYYLHIPKIRKSEEPLYQSRGFACVPSALIYSPPDDQTKPNSEQKGLPPTAPAKAPSEDLHRFSIIHHLSGIKRSQSLQKAGYLTVISVANIATWCLGLYYIPLPHLPRGLATWGAVIVTHRCAMSIYGSLMHKEVYKADKQAMEFYRSYKSSEVEKALTFSSPPPKALPKSKRRVKEDALDFLKHFAPKASLEFPSIQDRTARIKEWAKKAE